MDRMFICDHTTRNEHRPTILTFKIYSPYQDYILATDREGGMAQDC